MQKKTKQKIIKTNTMVKIQFVKEWKHAANIYNDRLKSIRIFKVSMARKMGNLKK